MKRRLDEMAGVGSSANATEKAMKVSEFNKWFNEKFTQYRLKDEETEAGYEAWFRNTGNSEDDCDETGNGDNEDSGSWADKVARLNQRKQELRNKYALVERQELEYAGGGGACAGAGYDLTRERPQEYSSGIFGNLRYEDLKSTYGNSDSCN